MELNQTIMGDMREILPQISPDSIDMIISDPPYNIPKRQLIRNKRPGSSRYFGKQFLGGNVGPSPEEFVPLMARDLKESGVIFYRLIERFTKPGEIILDPFAGSGASLKAAEQLGRKFIGIEIGFLENRKERGNPCAMTF